MLLAMEKVRDVQRSDTHLRLGEPVHAQHREVSNETCQLGRDVDRANEKKARAHDLYIVHFLMTVYSECSKYLVNLGARFDVKIRREK